MLPSPTEATIESKTTLVQTDAFPCTTEGHKLFRNFFRKKMDSRIMTNHNQHRRRRGDRKISNGKGPLLGY